MEGKDNGACFSCQILQIHTAHWAVWAAQAQAWVRKAIDDDKTRLNDKAMAIVQTKLGEGYDSASKDVLIRERDAAVKKVLRESPNFIRFEQVPSALQCIYDLRSVHKNARPVRTKREAGDEEEGGDADQPKRRRRGPGARGRRHQDDEDPDNLLPLPPVQRRGQRASSTSPPHSSE
jgi:hypothetical protein